MKASSSQRKSDLDISPALQKKMAALLLDDFGIVIDPERYSFASTSQQVYLISPGYKQIHPFLYVEKT